MSDQNQQPASDNQNGEDPWVKVGKYEVKVVRKDCIGAATCVAVAPNVFKLDGENIAVFTDNPEDTPENIVASAQGCPTKAILVKDAETGEMVWPK
jgi:ferredoxin